MTSTSVAALPPAPSTDEPAPTPLVAVLRRWYLAFPITLLGLFAGIAAAGQAQLTYVAQARLVVGTGDLAAYQVPGFAAASEQLAANYSRYLGLQALEGGLRSTLGDDADSVVSIGASPVPDSSVIRVEVVATSPDAAVAVADASAAFLEERVNDTVEPAVPALLVEFRQASNERGLAQLALTEAQSRLGQLQATAAPESALAPAREDVIAATTRLATAELEQTVLRNRYTEAARASSASNELRLVQPAVLTSDSEARTRARYALLGLVLGATSGGLLAVVLERRAAVRRARHHAGSALQVRTAFVP